jgi:hypothetical protein
VLRAAIAPPPHNIPALAENPHPSGCQPIQPLLDSAVAVAIYAIQVCFGACRVARLSGWDTDDSGQLDVYLGFTTVVS